MARKPNLTDHRYRNIRETKGKYRVVLEVCASPRRQAQKSFPLTSAGLRSAVEWRDITLGQITSGTYAPTDPPSKRPTTTRPTTLSVESPPGTFGALAERWLASKVGEVRPNTLSGYRNVLARPAAYFGDQPVQDITPEDVLGLRTALLTEHAPRTGRPASHRTVSYTLLAVRLTFAHGVKVAKVLDHNPAADVKAPRRSHLKERAHRTPDVTWTPEELKTFVRHLNASEQAPRWERPAFLLGACGLRRGEVLGLSWANVDFEQGTVTIEASRTRTGGENGETDRDDPKRPASRRVIRPDDIHPNTMQALADLHTQTEKDRAEAGLSDTEPAPEDLVVVDISGAGIDPDRYSATFRRLSRQAGVRRCKTHQLRHALASLMHDAGVPPKRAAQLLGHSIEVHLSTYVTATETGSDDAGRAVGLALWG